MTQHISLQHQCIFILINSNLTAIMKSSTPSKTKASPFKNDSQPRATSSKISSKKEAFTDPNIQQKLKKNRQKLTHTLDTFTMLIRSRNPIRCLQHNSAISIFCQTENKLLCTNCVFGKNQHRFHKMSPIDKSFELISDNIDRLTLSVNKQVNAIVNIKQVILNNLNIQEQDLHQSLQSLAIRYAEAQQLLNQCLYAAQQKLILSMEKIRAKHQTVAMEMSFLKDIYNVGVPIEINPIDFESMQILLYRHSLLNAINSQNKFQGNVWNACRKQVHSIGEQQLQKITEIKKQLKNILNQSFASQLQ